METLVHTVLHTDIKWPLLFIVVVSILTVALDYMLAPKTKEVDPVYPDDTWWDTHTPEEN